jgi:hypothetical protein
LYWGSLVLADGMIFNNERSFCPQITQDCIQMQRGCDGRPTGEAIVAFPSRADAERAILEKNRQSLGNRYVELFMV